MELKNFLASIKYTWYIFEGIMFKQNLELINFVERLILFFWNSKRRLLDLVGFRNMELYQEPSMVRDFVQNNGDAFLF